MKRWKRTILALVLAAVSAVATTVGPALYWRKKGIPPNYASSSPFEYWDMFEGQMVTWGTETSGFGMRVVEVYGSGQSAPSRTPVPIARSSPPAWGDFPGSVRGFNWSGEGYGFPCTVIWTSQHSIFGRMNVLDNEMRGLYTFQIAGERYTLPTRIHWPGVLINSVFFAALWGTILFAPVLASVYHRRRRGLCRKCGYDLRGTPHLAICPECGRNVAQPGTNQPRLPFPHGTLPPRTRP